MEKELRDAVMRMESEVRSLELRDAESRTNFRSGLNFSAQSVVVGRGRRHQNQQGGSASKPAGGISTGRA